MGGNTEYLDARKAYEDLDQETKDLIEPLVANNSMWYNRKTAAPDYYADVDPFDYVFSKQ